MKSSLAICLLMLLACSSAAETLLFENVTLLSPERDAALERAYVLINDDRIIGVGAGDARPPADRVIDGRGGYLTPGLIDSHVHLGSTGGMRGDHAAERPGLLQSFRDREPLNYLAFGFTTLIDVSSNPSFADRWRVLPLRPDLHFCIGVPFANGYGMAFEPVETRFNTPYFLYDPAQADVIPPEHRPEEHTPAAVIAKVAETDARCIKSYHETGFAGLFDFPVPPLGLIRDLVREAHNAGLTVLMHANSLDAQRFAVDAGADVIAHGPWHWDDWNDRRAVTGPVQSVLQSVVAARTGMQLTAQVIYGERDLLAGEFLANPRLRQLLPGSLLAWYASEDGGWFQRRLLRNYEDNPGVVERFIGRKPGGDRTEATVAGIERLKAATTYLAEANARFLFGTDTPSSPTYTNPPGLNGLLEIYALAELGLNNRQIFDALTLDNARAFGIDDSVGSVEAGKRANLLLLRDNPLESVAAWDSIEYIAIGGNVLSRESLYLDSD